MGLMAQNAATIFIRNFNQFKSHKMKMNRKMNFNILISLSESEQKQKNKCLWAREQK